MKGNKHLVAASIVAGGIAFLLAAPVSAGESRNRPNNGAGGQTRSENRGASVPRSNVQKPPPEQTRRPAVEPRLQGPQPIPNSGSSANRPGQALNPSGRAVNGGLPRPGAILDAGGISPNPKNPGVAPPAPNAGDANPPRGGSIRPRPGAVFEGGIDLNRKNGGGSSPAPTGGDTKPPREGDANPPAGDGAKPRPGGVIDRGRISPNPNIGGGSSPPTAMPPTESPPTETPPGNPPPEGLPQDRPPRGRPPISIPPIEFGYGGGGGADPAPGGGISDPGVESPAPEAQTSAPAVVETRRPVAEPLIDVEMLDVRLVDPGDPAKKLGPCYRIEFRNNSDVAIEHVFSVALIAGGPGRLTPQAPRTIEAVSGMKPEQTLTGDIRLPALESATGKEKAGHQPFTRLFVLIDSDDELNETDEDNNMQVLPRDGIRPVDLALEPLEWDAVHAGDELRIAGEGFGRKAGKITLEVGAVKLRAEITSWSPTGVTVQLPATPLVERAAARLRVTSADGQTSETLDFDLLPPDE